MTERQKKLVHLLKNEFPEMWIHTYDLGCYHAACLSKEVDGERKNKAWHLFKFNEFPTKTQYETLTSNMREFLK